ncbi:MAG: alpha/beta fold hydrolase [Acidimicrobiales bacterium]|nr:alpha/beta fold hydrolase [Acidimicrobiales bacterium]
MSASTPDPPGAPPLPRGRTIRLPDRGELFVREVGRPRAGQPSLLLLHGWTATADLNWFPAYEALRRDAHVVSFDLRGHGRGLRTPERFRLADCADDAAALADALSLDAIVPVGYSMGGLVAQLLWHRHPRLVRGLVLCATSRNFRGNAGDHLYFGGLSGLATAARLAPGPLREQAFARYLDARIGRSDLTPWAVAELARHDFRTVLEAGAAIGTFSSHRWVGDIDVPTSVVITTADTKIPPHRQRKLAAAIPTSRTFEVAADHHGCPRQPELFLPALRKAVRHVLAG